MKNVIKKIAVLTVAGATVAAMAVTASAFTPRAFAGDSSNFSVGTATCTGTMALEPYLITLTTTSKSSGLKFKTSAQYQYYDSNGVLRNGSRSSGATLQFSTPGSSPMCPYILGRHEATDSKGNSGYTNTQYGTRV